MPKLRDFIDTARSLAGLAVMLLLGALAIMVACHPFDEVGRRADFLRDCAVLADVGETGHGCPTLTPAPTRSLRPTPDPYSTPTATASAIPGAAATRQADPAPTSTSWPPTPTVAPTPRPTRTPTPAPVHPPGPTLTPDDARLVLGWADESCIEVMATEDKLGGCLSHRGLCYLVDTYADRWYAIDRRFAPPDAPFEEWVLYIGRADAEAYCATK